MHGALAGQDQAGSGVERDRQHHDWFPTFLATAGEPDIKEKLLRGTGGRKTYKVHLDAYNQLPYLTGR